MLLNLTSCSSVKEITEKSLRNIWKNFQFEKESENFSKYKIREEKTPQKTAQKRKVEKPSGETQREIGPTFNPKDKVPKPAKQEPSFDNQNLDSQVITRQSEKKQGALAESNFFKDLGLKELWGKVDKNSFQEQSHSYSIKFFGVVCGTLKIQLLPSKTLQDQEVYHFRGDLISSRYYRYIYEFKDFVESFVTMSDFKPLRYNVTQIESNKDVFQLQLFDHQKHQSRFWYKKIKDEQTTKKEGALRLFPFFLDPLSTIFFMRSLKLKEGDVVEFPVVSREKILRSKVSVLSTEEVRVNGVDLSARKYKAEAFELLKNDKEQPFKKKGELFFWLSNDEKRVLLSFESKFKFGSVSANLDEL